MISPWLRFLRSPLGTGTQGSGPRYTRETGDGRADSLPARLQSGSVDHDDLHPGSSGTFEGHRVLLPPVAWPLGARRHRGVLVPARGAPVWIGAAAPTRGVAVERAAGGHRA